MLSNDPNIALDGVIKIIQRAQLIIGEPDTDGMKATMVWPVLKAAIGSLTEISEPFKPKRGSK